MSEIKTKLKESGAELTDDALDSASGGTKGKYSYYCCKCPYPAEKFGHDGKYYCMKHWKETPDSKVESESYIKPRC